MNNWLGGNWYGQWFGPIDEDDEEPGPVVGIVGAIHKDVDGVLYLDENTVGGRVIMKISGEVVVT